MGTARKAGQERLGVPEAHASPNPEGGDLDDRRTRRLDDRDASPHRPHPDEDRA